MAIEKKIDCVILGLLSHEDLTGYEIKKRKDTSIKYFWGASYGSIYPALSDLVKRGLANKRDEADNNRNKIIYSITEEGRNYLKSWLQIPVGTKNPEYLHVFFMYDFDLIRKRKTKILWKKVNICCNYRMR